MSSELLRRIGWAGALGAVVLATGCQYQETLSNYDLKGVVRIPKDMAAVTMSDLTGESWTIENDPRAIGPVYLGVYASIDDSLYDYPHPSWGPVLDASKGGDTYPYGGTSAGRFAWGCYQASVCKTISGRYDNYQSVLDFFRDQVHQPITDDEGNEITSATEYQERCFLIEKVTSDDELDLVGPLEFEDMGDYFEAPAEIMHTWFEPGVSVWGFADMPSAAFTFSTCNPSGGDYHSYYNERYYKGTNYRDVLNYPGNYIGEGDLISAVPEVMDSPDQEFTLELGYKYAL